MKNLTWIVDILVDGQEWMERLKTLLRQRDSEFAPVEAAFAEIGQEVQMMSALRARQLEGDMRFALWQGLMLNLEHFRTPFAWAALKQDYTVLLREHILVTMGGHTAVQRQMDRLRSEMTPQQREEQAVVDEYYTYLETVGLKVAHYLGFALGDRLFLQVEPGYAPDLAATQYCRMELERYLGFSIE